MHLVKLAVIFVAVVAAAPVPEPAPGRFIAANADDTDIFYKRDRLIMASLTIS